MTELASHHTEAKLAGWCSEKTLLSVRTGDDPGEGVGDASPHQSFSNMLLMNTVFA